MIISVFCRLGLETAVPLGIEPLVMVALVLIVECAFFYLVRKSKLKKFLL